jgi:hypothetical protein
MTAAMPIKNGFSISQASDPSSTLVQPLGTSNYTIIAFCPILSHLTVNDTNSTIDGLQPSGLFCVQTNSTTATIYTNEWFGLNSAGTAGAGSQDWLAMESLYGTTSTGDFENFTYASELDARFVIPQANLTGTYYQGKMRLGQWFSSGAAPLASQRVTAVSLIRAADKVSSMTNGFTLKSSIVNDYILTHTGRAGSDRLTDYLQETDLGSELIEYVVLQTPSISITTGAVAQFSLI